MQDSSSRAFRKGNNKPKNQLIIYKAHTSSLLPFNFHHRLNLYPTFTKYTKLINS